MSEWLQSALRSFTLTEDVEDYLFGRGVREETIRGEGMVTWQAPLTEPAPDSLFRDQCGDRGERLVGMMVCPVRSPRGTLLGFEARSIHKKRILDFRLPVAKWCPFFIGTRLAMPAIWAGGDVWLGEGLFDKAPLEWAVPMRDAVLATVRAHLTPQQLDFLRRFVKGTVHVVFDHDDTGVKATHGYKDDTGKARPGVLRLLERVVDPMTKQCVRCRTSLLRDASRCDYCGWSGLKCIDVPYSGGKDPGEIWDKGGATAIKAQFAR
jgi:hypothetical protein